MKFKAVDFNFGAVIIIIIIIIIVFFIIIVVVVVILNIVVYSLDVFALSFSLKFINAMEVESIAIVDVANVTATYTIVSIRSYPSAISIRIVNFMVTEYLSFSLFAAFVLLRTQLNVENGRASTMGPNSTSACITIFVGS